MRHDFSDCGECGSISVGVVLPEVEEVVSPQKFVHLLPQDEVEVEPVLLTRINRAVSLWNFYFKSFGILGGLVYETRIVNDGPSILVLMPGALLKALGDNQSGVVFGYALLF